MNSRYDLLFRKSSFQDLRQKMLSKVANSLLNNVELDRLNVKHLEILSKNTLTTPKVALVESGADPAANGQITMNGGIIRGQSGGVVKNYGGVLATDASIASPLTQISTNPGGFCVCTGTANNTITVTPSKTPNIVHVVASIQVDDPNNETGGPVVFQILKGASQVASKSIAGPIWKTRNAIIIDYFDTNITSQAYTASVASGAGASTFICNILAGIIHL